MKGLAAPPPRFATLVDALAAAAGCDSGITLVDLHERETTVPFAEIAARAERAAAGLRAAGVAPGDRVALVLPTSTGFLDALFGTLLAGAVPVPLYPPLRLGRLAEYHAATARMLAAAGVALVVVDERTGRLLGQAIERARPRLGWRRAGDLAANRLGGTVRAEVGPDDLALIQYSSGATTDPKPVALTHRQVLAQLAAIRALLPPERGDRQLGVSWLPLYHDMGLIGCLLLAVYYPGPLVLIPPEHFLARPALWPRAIARHRATLSIAPPFGYALAARRVRDEEIAGIDLSSWRMAGCGAEPISIRALDAFARRFAAAGFDAAALRPCYGLAEAALAVTFAPADRPVRTVAIDPARLAAVGEAVPGGRAIVSVGTPVPGFEVEVRDDGGRPLPERRVGRVHTRGPSVMAGYFGRPEASARALDAGWLDTGDLGFVADGELYVCGREKDVIVIRGANRAPQEFEESADAVEGVRAGCVVALGFEPEGADGEELLVLAERARDGERDGGDERLAAAIRRAVTDATGVAPHTVRVLEPGTLPRTSSGKLRRSEALRRYLAAELAPPDAAGPARLTAEVARSALALARTRLRRGR
ncbi:MAG TPA: AMP-binding protein [Thermoanaerobaculaceae bacterium]|nr:AMP-binding protein [Thermoanaerobaculaceae bacterium]